MTRVSDTVSYLYQPVRFPKDRQATVGEIINWRKDKGPLEKLSYLAAGGIITAIVGTLISIFKNTGAKTLGILLALGGIGATIASFFGPDFSRDAINHVSVEQTNPTDKLPKSTEPDADYWIDVLSDSSKSAHEQSNAAKTLGKKKEKKAVNALIKALEEDDNVSVRIACAWALGEIGDKKALISLNKIAQSSLDDLSKRLISTARYAVKKLS